VDEALGRPFQDRILAIINAFGTTAEEFDQVTLEREREIYFKSHISLWEHSSHFRPIGRGVPSVCCFSANVQIPLLASPKENPQVPM